MAVLRLRLRGGGHARVGSAWEIPDQRWRWRIAAKVLAFFGVAYLTLINVRVRNFLVGLLGTFKQEH